MKQYIKPVHLVMFAALIVIACKAVDPMKTSSHVTIKSVNGKYNFYVNGSLFELKGAGGGGNLKVCMRPEVTR
jgi:hypothetical protein